MPVIWCHIIEDGKYCTPGFPIGCFITKNDEAKDACAIHVSVENLLQKYKLLIICFLL